MQNLESRLRVLELTAHSATVEAMNATKQEAYRCILSALHKALPAGEIINRHGRSHADKLCGLHDRLIDGTLTDDDRQVLAAVSPVDLLAVRLSVADVIAAMVRGYRSF